MFETIVIPIVEVPAPAGARMLLLPPFTELAVSVSPLKIFPIQKQVEVNCDPLLVTRLRVPIAEFGPERPVNPLVPESVPERTFIATLVDAINQPGDKASELPLDL